MARDDDTLEMEATVVQALPNAMFKLRLDDPTGGGGSHEILGFVSGKMRKHFIRILPGDKVKVQMSPYDTTKGRIVYRQR
jgi:translation initiation factor IF-1